MICSRSEIQFLALPAFLVLTLCCTGCEQGSPDAAATEQERIVAEVNGEPILSSRLDAVVQAERLRLGPEAEAMTARDEVELARSALDLLIRSELVYQAAQREGLTVSEEAIAEQLHVARSQFASDEEFEEYLHSAGTTTGELREEVRRRLMMQAYAETVTDDLEIDQARVRQLYETQLQRIRDEEQVRVSQILVRTRPGDSEEKRRAARAKIEQAYRRALAGEDFAELARQYSESPLAANGGDMGFIRRGRMLPEFEDVVFETPPGQLTPIFETPHGFNLVRVVERKEGPAKSAEEVRTGLLLVLAREQKNRTLHDHVDELEARAEIRILDPRLQGNPG